MSTTHRVRDSVKALTREQEKLLGQLKEVQADKEQSEVRLQVGLLSQLSIPCFTINLLLQIQMYNISL